MSDDGRDQRTHDRDLTGLQVLDPARDARPGAGHEPAAQALLDRILEGLWVGRAPLRCGRRL
jgi:hypothetical protein